MPAAATARAVRVADEVLEERSLALLGEDVVEAAARDRARMVAADAT